MSVKYLSVLKLDGGRCFLITDEVWASFGVAYHIGRAEDPHELFAKMIGEDRNTAKEVAYRMMYTNSAIKSLFEAIGEIKCQK